MARADGWEKDGEPETEEMVGKGTGRPVTVRLEQSTCCSSSAPENATDRGLSHGHTHGM